jgi:hypothetical protein
LEEMDEIYSHLSDEVIYICVLCEHIERLGERGLEEFLKKN